MEEPYRIYIWMGYTGLALAVFLLVWYILFSIGGGERIYEEYYVDDIGMVMNSVLSSNGDIIIDYNVDEKKGEFDLAFIDNCEIRISKNGMTVPYLSYFCPDNKFINQQEEMINLDSVRFKLINGNLVLEEMA
jgi:hypothetical protein